MNWIDASNYTWANARSGAIRPSEMTEAECHQKIKRALFQPPKENQSEEERSLHEAEAIAYAPKAGVIAALVSNIGGKPTFWYALAADQTLRAETQFGHMEWMPCCNIWEMPRAAGIAPHVRFDYNLTTVRTAAGFSCSPTTLKINGQKAQLISQQKIDQLYREILDEIGMFFIQDVYETVFEYLLNEPRFSKLYVLSKEEPAQLAAPQPQAATAAAAAAQAAS